MSTSDRSFYAEHSEFTYGGPFEPLLRDLPNDVAALARVVQGLIVHEHLALFYGVQLTDDARSSVHLRRVNQIVARVIALQDVQLDHERSPADRVAGNCRHFTVLMVAMLRAHGTPARARCGFGGYFTSGLFEDHWVCEYWRDDEQRWALVDAQLDRPQVQVHGLEFDPTDVPRDQFLIAGDAWQRCRAGDADADTFGLSAVDEFGLWWIAGNLMRDAAALNKVELLPWDCWGVMPSPTDDIDQYSSTLFDRLALLTLEPDSFRVELRELLAHDDRLRVPPTVHNAVLGRDEVL